MACKSVVSISVHDSSFMFSYPSLKSSACFPDVDSSTFTGDLSTKTDRKRTLVLPYVKGLSEDIGRACRPLNIITAFTSKYTLRRSLSWVKTSTPQEEKIGVIYRIPCECGAVYNLASFSILLGQLLAYIITVNIMHLLYK